MALYLGWMSAFGLSDPMPAVARLDLPNVTDETLKRLCTVDAGACAVRAGRAAEATAAEAAARAAAPAGEAPAPGAASAAPHAAAEAVEGCVMRHLTDGALVSLLHACFVGRTGDVHSDANRARMTEALRAARVPHCEWDSMLELLKPCSCGAALKAL